MFKTYYGLSDKIPLVPVWGLQPPAMDSDGDMGFFDLPRNIVVMLLLHEPQGDLGVTFAVVSTWRRAAIGIRGYGDVHIDRLDNSLTVVEYPSLKISQSALPKSAARFIYDASSERLGGADLLEFVVELLSHEDSYKDVAKWLREAIGNEDSR
jgi:hypothetical protein